jgi:hypothetical protein
LKEPTLCADSGKIAEKIDLSFGAVRMLLSIVCQALRDGIERRMQELPLHALGETT